MLDEVSLGMTRAINICMICIAVVLDLARCESERERDVADNTPDISLIRSYH